MVNAKQVQAVSQCPGPVVTAYLNTMSTEPSHHPVVSAGLTWMKNETESIARGLPAGERAQFQKQVLRIRKYLEGRHPQERSLVIFAGEGIWELVALQTRVRNELCWGSANMAQLFWLMHTHKPMEVVVVDRKGARFFRYQLQDWALLEKQEFVIDSSQWKREEMGHVTGQGVHKTRGSQRNVFKDRMGAQYARLCRETAERAIVFCRSEKLAGIYLVGSDELEGMVHAEILREFHLPVTRIKEDLGKLSDSEVQRTLEPLIAGEEKRNGESPVNALFGSKNGVILGVDETLAELQKGRVRALILHQDLELNLYCCSKCRRMDRTAKSVCGKCGATRYATTLREALPRLVSEQELELAIVNGEAGAELKRVGGMGGWLREFRRAAAR